MEDGRWRPTASDAFAATATPGIILGAILVATDGLAPLRALASLLLLAAPVTAVVHGVLQAWPQRGAARAWWSGVAAAHLVPALALLAPWARQRPVHGECVLPGILPGWIAVPHDFLLYGGQPVGPALPLTVLTLLAAAWAWEQGRRRVAGWLALVFPYFWLAVFISWWMPGCPTL